MSQRKGVVTAFVHEIDAKQGRLKVEYRAIEKGLLSPWAPVAVPMSGKKRGMLFMPEVGDEVLVGFADGEFDHPYILGYLWNGEHLSPETSPDQRVIVTPGGHQLRFEDKKADKRVVLESDAKHRLLMEDKPGQEKLELRSKAKRLIVLDDSGTGKVEIVSGNNRILLDDSAAGTKVELKAGKGVGVSITMHATPQPSLSIAVGAGNTLDVSSSGVTLNATGAVAVTGGGAASITIGGAANITVGGAANFTIGAAANITAAAAINLTCTAFNVNAAISNFNGVVRSTTLVSTAVVGTVYTPGLGNLL